VVSPWVPEQSKSHAELLESSTQPSEHEQFDAIFVPTNREAAGQLEDCIELARETQIPLIMVCSKRAHASEAIGMAERAKVKAYALDLPPHPVNPLGISFDTSSDEKLVAASSGPTRDLSTKRNLGLLLARMLGWRRLMFLDDDIYGVSKEDVDALAAGLSDHSVSVLIPEDFPDNSVACHANRLGGGEQGKFASAGGMGVRCDRDDLGFFPNIYNEDWFFFSEEAASRKIINVGSSRQREYDPYEHPERAVKEEFGDLLAEGLYARLDHKEGVLGLDIPYWDAFISSRKEFHEQVAESLGNHPDCYRDTDLGKTVRAAQVSIRAAQRQLNLISSDLCQRFVDGWQSDLNRWREYLATIPPFDSIESALLHLGLRYKPWPPPSTR
jgi:hypothetical protein